MRNGEIANIVSPSDGRDFRWRSGGMRREDEQRQDRKRRNDTDVALVRQREDRLLFFHAVLVVSPSGASRTMTRSSFAMSLSEICVAVDLASDQSVGRVPDLSNSHYYTEDKTRWTTNLLIEILYSFVVFCRKSSYTKVITFRARIREKMILLKYLKI